MILICGDFELSFSYLITPTTKFLEKNLVITKAEGTILKELNGKPAVSYLKNAGIIYDGMDPLALTIMPLCSANNGHERRMWVMLAACDNGDILCGTELIEGEVVSVGLFEQHIVLNSLLSFLEENITGKDESFLIFSCSVRSLTLGFNFEMEADYISQKLHVPYLFAYSAGEYCYSPQGSRYLNASIISCGFKES
jgi:hypothetical protein